MAISSAFLGGSPSLRRRVKRSRSQTFGLPFQPGDLPTHRRQRRKRPKKPNVCASHRKKGVCALISLPPTSATFYTVVHASVALSSACILSSSLMSFRTPTTRSGASSKLLANFAASSLLRTRNSASTTGLVPTLLDSITFGKPSDRQR